eukprot:7273189-Lingulodinium_polyedra.AAC.1
MRVCRVRAHPPWAPPPRQAASPSGGFRRHWTIAQWGGLRPPRGALGQWHAPWGGFIAEHGIHLTRICSLAIIAVSTTGFAHHKSRDKHGIS